MHMDWLGWGMGGGWLFMVLFWILVAGAIASVVVVVMRRTEGGARKDDSALDILKKRYARGEISREEFEKTREDLLNK